MKIGETLEWAYKDKAYDSKIDGACPKCKAVAVIELPDAIRAEQPDETTHVCHPLAGGCNHGFALNGPLLVIVKVST